MKYDFTTIMDRAGHDAIAVDLPEKQMGSFSGFTRREGFDTIPMWVADMNFATVPTIQQAMIDRINHPAFGYFMPRDEYFNSIIRWHKERNHVEGLTKENIGYENGVLGGVISAVNILCSKGDNILVHSPTYIGFTMVLTNNGYNIVHSPLYKDEENIWRMDYEDMEKKIVENHIHTAIICNPHNPCGRVWTKEELAKCMEIFEKHEVYVISDEIWSDLMLNGHTHTPTQMINEYAKTHTIAFYAPSKTFNLAGLIGSYHIVYNQWLNDRLNKESSLSHYNSMNVLSMHALIGAYRDEGYEWLDQLKEVLSDNVNYAYDFITNNFEGITLCKPEATYMLYLDCKEYCQKHHLTIHDMLMKAYEYGVFWQDGEQIVQPYTIRMNLALPHSRVIEALDRLNKYVIEK